MGVETMPYRGDMAVQSQRPWVSIGAGHDFGLSHPMAPVRIDLTLALARELGLLDPERVITEFPEPISDDVLGLCHDLDYIAAVHAASESGAENPARGLGTSDVPVHGDMHTPAATIVGGTWKAAQQVWQGLVPRAVNISGGMHHAQRGAASGFCVYNDAAVAIASLLAAGAERIVYLDFDAHHGDGVEAIFWDDPRVLTVSFHQSPATLYPGTGYPTDVGGSNALGTAVNVALPPGTSSAGWWRAVLSVVPDVAHAFEPQLIVSQHGCDAHGADELTDLDVGLAAQRAAAHLVDELSQRYCGGKWLALGGGGYDVASVVPRAWVSVIAAVIGHDLEPDQLLPQAWRDEVTRRTGKVAPESLLAGEPEVDLAVVRPWSAGYDPANEVDRAIRATRQAVLPHLGVDVSSEI